jgi:diacylglycerol kinase family enzyme
VTVRRLALIVNPYATRVSEARLAAVAGELERAGEVTVLRTEHPMHAAELATGAVGGGYAAVVVFSGDGGFNEVVNGLEGDVPVGFLPGGGTSVLPRALGLPPDPVAAAAQVADAIERGRTRRITLGRVNGRRFAFNAGVGLPAEAVRRVDELGRGEDHRRPGDFSFALAIARALASRQGRMEPRLEVKGVGRAACLFVANASPYTYALRFPVRLVPEADFELGLDLVAPVVLQPRSLVRTAVALLRGRPQAVGALYGHDLDRIEVVCDEPTPLEADGEDLGDVSEAVFEAERGGLAVLA